MMCLHPAWWTEVSDLHIFEEILTQQCVIPREGVCPGDADTIESEAKRLIVILSTDRRCLKDD